jgi:hypothetical protein
MLRRLRWHLRHRLDDAECRAILEARLRRREADFLAVLRSAVYGQPRSPYRRLLEWAGCEYGDVEGLVGLDGVEGALRALLRRGVYLTVDEFKGRRPAIRGSAVIEVDPSRLLNPGAVGHLIGRSSGSRSPRTPVPMDLAFIRDRAVNACLALHAQGEGEWRKAVWADPGGCLALSIRFSMFGRRADRSFSLVDLADPDLDPGYRWSARALAWGSRLAGVPLPAPEHVPVDDPLPIARWIREVRHSGGLPHLWTYVSPAVRLCQAGVAAGIDLGGARLTVTGEPLTAARLAAIRAAGAEAVPDYGSAESGFIAYGCLAADAPDDVHLFQDLHAMLRLETAEAAGALPPGALLVSSLRPTAPVVLLNVSMGDRAEVSCRPCGCALERLGWTTHLHTIRSYEKLTAGGMTFLDTDVIRVLEEALPARFGGGPTDYQLAEEETLDGRARIRLLVHPAVGPLDTREVADAFLGALGSGSRANRMMALHWREAGLLVVDRQPPRAMGTGKILHLHRAPGSRGDTAPPPPAGPGSPAPAGTPAVPGP